MITYRESKIIQRQLWGETKRAALRAAGFPDGTARNPSQIITAEMKAELARLQEELVKNTLEAGLVDAIEIHEYLTEALRADMRDIRNEDGSFKPQSQWPAIWGRMMEAGDVDVEYLSERSHDGETRDKAGGWDEAGVVKKVKVRFASRVKLLELAMKHKGVDALASDKHEVAVTDVTYRWQSADDAKQIEVKGEVKGSDGPEDGSA